MFPLKGLCWLFSTSIVFDLTNAMSSIGRGVVASQTLTLSHRGSVLRAVWSPETCSKHMSDLCYRLASEQDYHSGREARRSMGFGLSKVEFHGFD